jgi:adenosylcobinamide kinase/adenosylcobinamide-phosphate guanylyltransferase
MPCTLILGGARSGKSAHAEKLAEASGKQIVYIATAEIRDDEMSERIALHRERRNSSWITVEEPFALARTIEQWKAPERLILVDCLTVWLSNLLFSENREYPDVGKIVPPELFKEQRQKLLDLLTVSQADIVFVSNEVGLGIVPQGAISRWFADEAGRLNQAMAAQCEHVIFIAAGLPLKLKGG